VSNLNSNSTSPAEGKLPLEAARAESSNEINIFLIIT